MRAYEEVAPLVTFLERELAEIYGFTVQTSAIDCLIPPQEAYRISPSQYRAGVLINENSETDTLSIGVFFSEDILQILNDCNPLEKLELKNLDAFCVVIEELSHFHLISNRANQNKTISRLELEWQGEVDKVLISGLALLRQTGSTCFQELFQAILGSSQCYVSNVKVYEEATRYAARYWHNLLCTWTLTHPRRQWQQAAESLKKTYYLSWEQKFRLFCA